MKDVLLILAGALAGGLGWGLRGQVGHEIGAMAPGALVAAVLHWVVLVMVILTHNLTRKFVGHHLI